MKIQTSIIWNTTTQNHKSKNYLDNNHSWLKIIILFGPQLLMDKSLSIIWNLTTLG